MFDRNIETQKFKFDVSSGDESYINIGICEEFGFGFMERDSGYIFSLFGPEIYKIKKEYTFTETKLIKLYKDNGRYYYPKEEHVGVNGAVDVLMDGDIYRYNESGGSFDGEKVISLNNITNPNNNPIILKKEDLGKKFKSGKAIALWPLIEKANR